LFPITFLFLIASLASHCLSCFSLPLLLFIAFLVVIPEGNLLLPLPLPSLLPLPLPSLLPLPLPLLLPLLLPLPSLLPLLLPLPSVVAVASVAAF
jgi:hypothetical protein